MMSSTHPTPDDAPSKSQSPFGLEWLDPFTKAKRVKDLFGRVANRYDLMNDLMSGGLHRCWKKRFIARIQLPPLANVVDVAAGTGDIALGLATTHQLLHPYLWIVDPTPSMLNIGRQKAIDLGVIDNITWTVASAEALTLDDASMDVYTISFGLRNTTDRARALAEAWRVLKPGGRFYCLEFSEVTQPLVHAGHYLYTSYIVPFLGQVVTGDRAAYQYLVDSIRTFPSRSALEAELVAAGFEQVTSEAWNHGIVAVHMACKPAAE